MTAIQKIVCAVDFSEASDEAIAYAVGLARELGAELHVVHAYQIPMLALPDGAVLPSPEWTADASQKLQKGLADLRETYGEGVSIQTHLREGMPHTEVAALCSEIGADLLVIGTHGRTGLSHLLLGSVAGRIVRTSDIPVITVPMPREEG